VVVLIDDNSATTAELFVHAIRLERRGRVIGNRSAGAVQEARDFDESTGTDDKPYSGLPVTTADILTTDGKGLENTGVRDVRSDAFSNLGHAGCGPPAERCRRYPFASAREATSLFFSVDRPSQTWLARSCAIRSIVVPLAASTVNGFPFEKVEIVARVQPFTTWSNADDGKPIRVNLLA
jgi:hypothetical protein